jgi:uncharacterized membrane protein YphA (DoxX/SURF4 family)
MAETGEVEQTLGNTGEGAARVSTAERGTPTADGSGASRPAWRILALLAGGVFVYAGVVKLTNIDAVVGASGVGFISHLGDLRLADPMRFANDISNYHIVPWPVGVRLAFYLPWLEILCGLAVIAGVFRRGALAIATALMLVFIAASVVAKARGIDVSCGCFGEASKKLTFTTHLIVDVLILGALVLLWRREMSLARTAQSRLLSS